MEIWNRGIRLLNKPFPVEESHGEFFKITIVVSLFITFFLFFFQPFNISSLDSYLFPICLGFGFMTFLASLFFEYIICPILRIKVKNSQYTFGRWIIYMTGVMLCISLANFIFGRSLIGDMNWEFFPHMLRGTFMIGVFPVLGLGAFHLWRQERKYLNLAAEINGKTSNHIDFIDKGQAIFNIPINKIRFIEALQNYVKIGFINDNGQLKEQTERATIKSILEKVEGSPIVKCHRSFLVNRNEIVSTSGNAQGLLLTLSGAEKAVPVSRSWVSVFK